MADGDNRVVLQVAWIGGPTGRGFHAVERKYAAEGMRLIGLEDPTRIPRGVDVVLCSESMCEHQKRAQAKAWAVEHGALFAIVPPEWSRAASILRDIGVFSLVERHRRAHDAAAASSSPPSKPSSTTAPESSMPEPKKETQPSADALRALLANLPAALIDVVLEESPRLKKKKEAAVIASTLEALDEDGALEVAIVLSTTARVRLRKALEAA